jgi:hypothetical protein
MPSLPSSKAGASPVSTAAGAKLFHEPAERQAARGFILSRQFCDVKNVGKNLLTGRAEREGQVRPCFSQKHF